MDRFHVRIFGTGPGPDAAIAAFHNWIQQNSTDQLLIDVVDYRHVPGGPGVMLIGHEGDYSLASCPTGVVLTYAGKHKHAGSDAEKIRAAFRLAVAACQRLSGFSFDYGSGEIIVNDRTSAPNTDDSFITLQSALMEVFGPISVIRIGEPRSRLGVRLKSTGATPLTSICH